MTGAAIKPFPDLNSEEKAELINDLQQWSLSKGLIIYPPNFKSYEPNVAPVTLYPTPFPKNQFEKALNIGKDFNSLYANIVIEKKWLTNILEELAIFDAGFTGKLYESYLKAAKVGIVQPVSLGLFRSDYMLDLKTDSIKQVEFNTVSVSFGGLSSKVGQLHRFLNDKGLYQPSGDHSKYYTTEELPISESASALAKGLYHGVSYYESHHTKAKTIVLFVVQPNERNAFDQRAVEFELFDKYGISSKRLELPEVTKVVEIDAETKKLYYNKQEVSVVYYRSAYGPQEFDCEETWECREVLESTMAIKCPSLMVQLSGAKKIQQLLTNDSIFDKFLSSSSKKDLLKSTFVKIYPLDDSKEGEEAYELALSEPQNFVVKPQREGGGNNIYKEDIPDFLKKLTMEERAGYILMELIHPPIHENVILRNEQLIENQGGIISELGVFGCILFNESNGEILTNEISGHLLRSKTSSSNEGGVAAGFGCVDSLYLY